MKKIIIFTATVSLLITGCNQKSYSQESTDNRSFSTIALPAVPEKLDFAGEAVPLENFDIRESLQEELLVTCYTHSRTFQTILNTKRYFSIIEPILEKNNIPNDFKYLCVAESGLNPEVASGAGAAGLWQFMPKTAPEYGMIVSPKVDERYHIEKATEAACKYFQEAYNKLGSWTLAAAAYNVGNNGVNRRMVTQGTKSYYDTYLPQETMRYVFRILSYKVVMSDPAAYGFIFEADDYFKPLDDYTVVTVSGPNIKWSEVARSHGTNYKMLRLLNPWIRDYNYENKSNLTLKVKVPASGFRTE